jgi:DNA-binding CsgD family transcriptional regulator
MSNEVQAERHLQVLGAVQDAGEAFVATQQLEPVLERIIYSAIQLTGGESGSVMLVDVDDLETLVVTAAIGPRREIILNKRQKISDSVAGVALSRNQIVSLRGRADGSAGIASAFPQELSWGVAVPLMVSGRLLGVLNVNNQTGRAQPDPSLEPLLRLLANQVSIMIEYVRLFEDLRVKELRLEQFAYRKVNQAVELRRDPTESSAIVTSRRELLEIVQEALQPILNGERQPAQAERVSPQRERLTEREREVLELIVEGMTNKEIASRLYLSPDTVKNHVVHVMEKLGATDRTQAAVIAIRNGLVK